MTTPYKAEKLVRILGEHDFQDEADSVGLIGRMSNQGGRSFGHVDKLLLARSLALSFSIPASVSDKFEAAYEALKKAHEVYLHETADNMSHLLMQAPGLVTFDMIRGDFPADGEPMKAVTVAPAQSKPYREASLAVVYGDDNTQLPHDSSFIVDFHPHKFPERIFEVIAPALAEHE